MKKNMLLSLLLVLLGISIFIFLKKKTTNINDNIIKLSWSDIRKDLLTSIKIENHKDNTYFSLQKEQGIWHLTHPNNIPIKPEQSLLLINNFLILTPTQIITNITSSQYTNYGLDKPLFTITGVFKDKTNGFIIGDKTSVGNHYYISDLNNTNNVYIVTQESIEIFLNDISFIVNNSFLTESTDDLVYVSFRNTIKEHIIITNENGFWKQLKPEENVSVDWGTRKFLLSAKDLSFYPKSINFKFTETDLQALGINKETSPMLLLKLTNGKQLELYIGYKTDQNNYPILIANNNMLAYSSDSMINTIFNTSQSDFITK